MFGSTLDASDRRDRGRPALKRDADDGADDLREAGQWVEPALHRPRACVVGAPGELDDVVSDRGDRVDDADRQPLVLEDRALLDVQLDPGVDVVACGLGICPGSRPTASIASPIVVVPSRLRIRSALVRPDRADDRARAPEVGRVKAACLLLAERHGLERAPRLAELLAQSPECDDPRDHAERAVVAAARVLRVDVRAGRDYGAVLGSGQAPPDVPDRVVARFQPGVLEPAGPPGSARRPTRASRRPATLRFPRMRRAARARRCTARRAPRRLRSSRAESTQEWRPGPCVPE
jgi:hypothetical protein